MLLSLTSCKHTENIDEELVLILLEEKILKRVPFIGIPNDKGQVMKHPSGKLLLSKQVDYTHIPKKMLNRIERKCLRDIAPLGFSFLDKNRFQSQRHTIQLVDFDYQKNIKIEEVLKTHDADAALFLTPFCFTHKKDRMTTYITYYCGGLCGSIDKISFEKRKDMWEIVEYKSLNSF